MHHHGLRRLSTNGPIRPDTGYSRSRRQLSTERAPIQAPRLTRQKLDLPIQARKLRPRPYLCQQPRIRFSEAGHEDRQCNFAWYSEFLKLQWSHSARPFSTCRRNLMPLREPPHKTIHAILRSFNCSIPASKELQLSQDCRCEFSHSCRLPASASSRGSDIPVNRHGRKCDADLSMATHA